MSELRLRAHLFAANSACLNHGLDKTISLVLAVHLIIAKSFVALIFCLKT